jgi:hypothetical protein
MANRERVSLQKLQTAGFIDGTYEFTDCRTENTDFEGRAQDAVPAFIANLTDQETGEIKVGAWKAGNAADWEADGEGFLPVGDKTLISDKSKYGQFWMSCKDAGFDEKEMDTSVKVFEGMVAKLIPIENVYKGLKDEETGEDAKSRNVIVERIEKLPYETKKKGGKKEGAKKESKGSDIGEKDLEAADTFVLGQLAEAGEGGVSKNALFKAAFADEAFKGAKTNQTMAKLIHSDEYLNSDGRPFVYSDGIVRMAD